MSLPKLIFQSCDETSLKVSWDKEAVSSAVGGRDFKIGIQYKEPHEEWEKAAEFEVRSRTANEVNLTEGDASNLVDLKPGTPYYVRIKIQFQDDSSILYGQETVFDTKPVDCTPSRKKKCVIS